MQASSRIAVQLAWLRTWVLAELDVIRYPLRSNNLILYARQQFYNKLCSCIYQDLSFNEQTLHQAGEHNNHPETSIKPSARGLITLACMDGVDGGCWLDMLTRGSRMRVVVRRPCYHYCWPHICQQHGRANHPWKTEAPPTGLELYWYYLVPMRRLPPVPEPCWKAFMIMQFVWGDRFSIPFSKNGSY